MIVRIIDEKEKNFWNDYVYHHPNSIAWHVYEWNEVIQKNYNLKYIPLALFNNNKIEGIFPLYQLNDTFLSVAYAVAGGMLANHKEGHDLLLKEAVKISKENNIKKIILKQYKHQIQSADLCTDDNYYNKELDLSDSLEDVFSNFDQKNQDVINNSDLDKYELIFDNQKVDVFYHRLLGFLHKNGTPCVSKKWIKDLVDFGMYDIALLKKGKKIIAGTLTKKFKETVSFPFTFALSNKKENINEVYILYWLLIKQFREEGIKIFHSGRIPQSNETLAYRLGWGGRKHNYYYQYFPSNIFNTEFNQKRGLKRKILSTGWKLLPRFVIRYIGPKITAKYP
ncbi:MAG: hypothetical protein MJB14_06835 [Spirochaetes bacterium]|nr:hypothetical protein [Spirochaetota bacterium]